MDEHTEFERYYQEILAGEELPEPVTAEYRILRCLRRGEGKELYLAADRRTYRHCIIKLAYGRQREFLRQEAESLRQLWKALEEENGPEWQSDGACGNGCSENAAGGYMERTPQTPGIVRIYEWLEGEEYSALIREYCEGVTLKHLTDRRGGLTEAETVEYGIQICGLLGRMHRMVPRMIHRDVKPENFLVTADGYLVLLDFDAARRFQPGKERDTVFVGSKDTAAPEQFGFGQTDVRTDIYGAGRTLLYLLCGSYEERRLADADCSGKLKKVIRRAAAFAPDERYQQAELLREALEQCGREPELSRTRRGKRRLRQATAGLAGAAAGAVLTALVWAPAWKGSANLYGGEVTKEEGLISSASVTEGRDGTSDGPAEDAHVMFDPEVYRAELDRAIAAYRSRDYETLGDASRWLVEQLYGDSALEKTAAEDRRFFESGDFSETMIWRGEVSMTVKLNYRLWNDDELLLRKLDCYRTNGRRIADAMDEMLNAAAEDGRGIVILYDYLFSENADDLHTADILWDYLSVLTTAVFPLEENS